MSEIPVPDDRLVSVFKDPAVLQARDENLSTIIPKLGG